ncbi:MAG: hypothetical protein KDG44_06640 [Burkholderiaceae bacterium]|nr:hypothetical protein [Burkholderiaceae bacterium]
MSRAAPARALRRGPVGVIAVALAGACLAAPAWGCALEGDDVVLQRSALDVAYPEAINVLGAVSAARHSGLIDRWRGLDDPTTAEERRAERARIEASLVTLRARLAATVDADAPALAIVLVEPMLWSRLAAVRAGGTQRAGLALAVHTAGPTRGDVVAVTDEPVLERLNHNQLPAAQALSLGLLRLYGPAPRVEAVRAWLVRGDATASATRPEPSHQLAAN